MERMSDNARQDYYGFIRTIIKALTQTDVNIFEIAAARQGITVEEMLNDTDYFYSYDLPWAWTTDKNCIFHMDCKVEKIEEGVVTLFEMGEGWGERHELQSVDQLPTETLVDIYFDWLNH